MKQRINYLRTSTMIAFMGFLASCGWVDQLFYPESQTDIRQPAAGMAGEGNATAPY